MINPKYILSEIVATLAGIPDLVAALSSDPGNDPPWSDGPIAPYSDGPSTESNLRIAILQMPPGTVLVAWLGTRSRRLQGSTALLFSHQYSIFLRAPETGASYEDLFNLIVAGIPTTPNNPSGLPMLHVEVDPFCYPMDLDLPVAQRNTIVVSADGATFDYFEIQVSFVESGAI